MPVGFRLYNPVNGAIVLDITDRISRVLGQFEIPTNVNSGSVTIPSYSGTFFVTVRNDERSIQTGIYPVAKSVVTISVSGNTLTWTRTLTGFGTPEYTIPVIFGAY